MPERDITLFKQILEPNFRQILANFFGIFPKRSSSKKKYETVSDGPTARGRQRGADSGGPAQYGPLAHAAPLGLKPAARLATSARAMRSGPGTRPTAAGPARRHDGRSAKFQQNVARFRLYRHRFLQENTRFAAFFKLYKICILMHRCSLNF